MLFLREVDNLPDANFIKGLDNYKKQNYGEALKQFKKARVTMPKDPEILYKIANIYYQLDEIDKAIEYYEEACKLNPDDEVGNFILKFMKDQRSEKII
ncbi:MAG: tetratricopeptide repeat protein [Candidatus Hodarchaeales archaeon]|jgi:tetratricopeptide (TPR) repeat protein